MINRATNH